MKTGKSNLSEIRMYNSIWNYDYVTYNYSWFNGSDVISINISPWDGEVPIIGTDSAMN